MSINKLVLEGRLVQDPELRTTKGKTFASFDIAVQEGKNSASFFSCTCFDGWAESLAENAKKGDALIVVGRLQQDRWRDPETNENRSRIKVVAEQVKELRAPNGKSHRRRRR